MPELHVREMAVRAETEDGKREFSGIAVPYGDPVEINDWFGSYTEEFERGAVQDSDDAKVFWRHAEPIGRITSARDTDAGWEITGVISQTPRGDEAYTLLRDGVIDRMSIGFDFGEYREEHDTETNTVRLVHTKVKVREVSLVPFPAYEGAQVATVRHRTAPKENPVPETATETPATRADVDQINETIAELDRSFKMLQANGLPNADAASVDVFRSYGHYVKALVTGDEQAKRAFDGAVSGDGLLQDQWIGDIVELQQQAQPIVNTFSTGALPAQGLTVEYGILDTDTTDFQRQVAEGDTLVHGKVSLTTANAPVYTAGGYSSLSVQAIERTTNINLLDTTWEAIALKAAKYTEGLTRSVVTAGYNASVTAGGARVVTADLTTAAGLREMVLDVYEHFDDQDLLLDGILVAKDVFLAIADVQADKSILQIAGAPDDKLGRLTINTKTPDGDIAGLTVRLFPKAAAGTVFAFDSRSVKTLEAPGAPFRITNDLNVVDLTKPIGMYTYVSSFVQRPKGIVPLVTA